MKKLIVIILLMGRLFSQSTENSIPIYDYSGQEIWDIKDIPEEKVDIGLWALIIAKEYDSTIAIDKYLSKLNYMSDEIKKMVAGREKDMVKFVMTRMFIYEQGVWNNHKVFTYDLEDPLGKKLENQLLSSYLETYKGNCVSMPTLFLALMSRVDPSVKIHGVRAPLHLFCRFHDPESGDVWNVETTNGGNPARNIWYIENLGITQTAIDSNSYMNNLTKKEYIAELLNILISRLRREEKYKEAMKYVKLVLELNPKSITGLVHRGALYSWYAYQAHENAIQQCRNLDEIEKDIISNYTRISKQSIGRANELGWYPESNQQREKYLNTVNEENQNRN